MLDARTLTPDFNLVLDILGRVEAAVERGAELDFDTFRNPARMFADRLGNRPLQGLQIVSRPGCG